MQDKSSTRIIRWVSAYLLWFSIVFLLATLGDGISFLEEGTTLGDLLIRRPYELESELMFTVLFFVWGVFLWRSSSNIESNHLFIRFSAWTLLTHGIVFTILGFISETHSSHFFSDSILWLVAGGLVFWVLSKKIS